MYVAGIDIGSLSSKAVIMKDHRIVCWAVTLTCPSSQESAAKVMDLALKNGNLRLEDLSYIVATGYGRINVSFSQATLTEISCHARGNNWFFPEVRTILDMGGQDCKAIRCDGLGLVADFVLNEKCAAGTGRYLERIAAGLELELDQIGPLSLEPVVETLQVSNFCVVFAERDVFDLLRKGKSVSDILAAATDSIVERVLTLLNRVHVVEALCVSGGVAKNIGVVRRVERELDLTVRVAPEPQIVGAVGAALFAADRGKRQMAK